MSNSNKIKIRHGIPCLILNSTASTNDNAVNFPIEKDGELLVCAKEQTAGRGRYDRSFLSLRNKGAYFSYRFPCDFEHSYCACVIALAVVEALETYGLRADIKWPNDVLVKDRKICGILPEGVEIGGRRFAILGVGVNLNYTRADFTGELSDRATSLLIETGKSCKPQKFALAVIGSFKRLLLSDPNEVFGSYSAKSVTVGKTVRMEDGEWRVKAISPDYSLLLERDGLTQSRVWGEIISYE